MKKIAIPQITDTHFLLHSLFGGALLTLGSCIRVPLIPIPFTLQTLALFLLALTQSPKQACASCCAYLFAASCGLPVLGGVANTFWIGAKTGGYLIAFPFAAYLISRLRNSIHPFLALLSGQVLIFLLGWLWLIPFLGAYDAFLKGILILLPSAVLKMFAALAFIRWRNR